MLYGIGPHDRIFTVTKSYLHNGAQSTDIKVFTERAATEWNSVFKGAWGAALNKRLVAMDSHKHCLPDLIHKRKLRVKAGF